MKSKEEILNERIYEIETYLNHSKAFSNYRYHGTFTNTSYYYNNMIERVIYKKVQGLKKALIFYKVAEYKALIVTFDFDSSKKEIEIYPALLIEDYPIPIEEAETLSTENVETSVIDKVLEKVKKSKYNVDGSIELNFIDIALLKGLLLSNFTLTPEEVKNIEFKNVKEYLKNSLGTILESNFYGYIQSSNEVLKWLIILLNDKKLKNEMSNLITGINKATKKLSSNKEEVELYSLAEEYGVEKTIKLLKSV